MLLFSHETATSPVAPPRMEGVTLTCEGIDYEFAQSQSFRKLTEPEKYWQAIFTSENNGDLILLHAIEAAVVAHCPFGCDNVCITATVQLISRLSQRNERSHCDCLNRCILL